MTWAYLTMPRDGSATRQLILDTAERLSLDQGFSATAVEQIIAESGTSKGAFFHHFASKNALAVALSQRYAAADIDTLGQVVAYVEASEDDPAARVVEFIRVYEDGADEVVAAQPVGLYATITVEGDLIEEGATTPIAEVVAAWREAVSPWVSEALATSNPRRRIDPDALVDHIIVTTEGALLLARATGEPDHLRRQLALLRHLVESLLLR